MAPAPSMTVDEYFRTPESVLPSELMYGAMRVAEAPTVWHQQAVAAFHLALAPHIRARRLGQILLAPVDVVFDAHRHLVMQPDLLFIAESRSHIIGRRVMGAPDMVVEVLSPQPRIGTIEERIRLFAQYGVREMWLLHQTNERFEIVTTREGNIADRQITDYYVPVTSTVLPQFTSSVAAILR